MDWIASRFAGAFLGAVFTNDEGDIKINGCQMLDYWFFKRRIDAALDDTPGCPWPRAPESRDYLFLLLLLSFRRWDQTRWLGERIYLGRDHNEPGMRWSNTSPVGGFTLRLYQIFSGRTGPEESYPSDLPASGAYGGLFANWSSPERLKQSIVDACDYHLCRMREDPEVEYDIPEFASQPYRVLPVEILALRAVRERMGLDTSFPSHPLLDSSFVRNLPDELHSCAGGLLQDVIDATEKVLPGFLTEDPLHIRPGVVDIPPPSPPSPPPPVFPVGLQREVEKFSRVFGRKATLVIRYHIPAREAAARCGREIFTQLVKDYADRKRIGEVDIYVTGSPEDMRVAYITFQEASKEHPEAERWLLEEIPELRMDFETPEGDKVRGFFYWTEGVKRHRMEFTPTCGTETLYPATAWRGRAQENAPDENRPSFAIWEACLEFGEA